MLCDGFMLKKIVPLILIAILLCGCVKKTEEEITFASWGSITEVEITKKIISDFEKNNPDIKVKFMHIPQNYFQKLHLLFASNTAPDVIFVNNLNLPVYAKYLEELNVKDKQDFYKPALDGLSYHGKLLAVPRDISNLVFYVNTDKTDLPRNTWKIEDILKITKPNMYTVSYEEDIYWILPYLSYFGGGIFDYDSNLVINSDESKKAISFYKDLRTKYHIAPTRSQIGSSTLAQMFLDGKIIFYLSGRWMYPKINEKAGFNWAIINFPYGIYPQPCDVSGWAVSKNSKHKNAAKRFVEYISNENSSEYYAQTGLIVPARIKPSKKLNNNLHNERVFLEVINHSEKTNVGNNYKKLVDKINLELDL